MSGDKLSDFLGRAQAKRNYPLGPGTAISKALTHLNLLENNQPNNAAILLFGKLPQRFVLSSHIKCLHFHGTIVSKPIPSYQTYKGTIFEMVEQDFVMSRIDLFVGTREKSNEVPTRYEIPRLAVSEAIVNAVAHRDYTSNASVQVMLFADRLEIWNPGQLPPPLTPERLQLPHASIPHNPLIAESLYLAGIIEQAGTGILDIIELCRSAGLPKPEFRQDGGFFVQTIWRDWLTETILTDLSLNDRQINCVQYLKQNNRITNKTYQNINKVTDRTALRDLDELVRKKVLQKNVPTGRNTYYSLQTKPDINPTPRCRRYAVLQDVNQPNALCLKVLPTQNNSLTRPDLNPTLFEHLRIKKWFPKPDSQKRH